MKLNPWARGLACLIPLWAVWAHPVWAQSQVRAQGHTSAQAKPKTQPGVPAPQNKVPSRVVSADITAQLQALAAAEAAARSASVMASTTSVTPDVSVPVATELTAALFQPQPALVTERPPAALPEPSVTPNVAPELLIAQQIHQGHLPCELGASVRIEADALQPGVFLVQGKGFRYRMFPVPTSTGALRLEDKKAGAVWLQLANKSMLMDQKKGRRLADECAHPDQLAFAESMKTNPPPSLIDTKGMGR